MPAWVAAAIETTTGSEPRLTGDRAIPARCTCGTWTLKGYDGLLLAGLAVVDPNPLSSLLEAAAVVLYIATYRLWGSPHRWSLIPRNEPGVRRIGTVPSADDVVVLAAHRCGYPPLSAQQLRLTCTAAEPLGEPPF